MKKNLAGLVLICVCTINSYSQSSNDYNKKISSCQSELNTLQGKRAEIDAEYDKIVAELRQGLFCSLCNQSKSQIEKGGTNFYQHIKEVKGRVVEAPPQAYEQAHKACLAEFNSWQQEVQDKQKSCDNLRSLSQNAANNEQKQLAQQNQQRQQQAQDQFKQQQELNRQQQEKLQQQLAEAVKEQQAKLDAQKFQQQQDFSQSVSNYVNGQSDEIKQRQEVADNIGQQGAALAKSIQGNKIDGNKIAPENISGSSIFSGAPSYEDVLKTNEPRSNNYFEQYKSLVEDVGQKTILAESNLSETFKDGVEKVKKYISYGKASKDFYDGKITENTVKSYFSGTSNAVIKTIQKHSGSLAVKQANTITDLSNRMLEEDFSERDINRAVSSMNPLHFSPTFVKEEKPFNFKDAAVVVGGGIVLSTIGAPIWLGIGAAAWYGFNR